MAIYTEINATQLQGITAPYCIEVLDFNSIRGGNANTSYYLEAKNGEYILTIVEERTMAEMQNLVSLLHWLKLHNFSTSELVKTREGNEITLFERKPVLIKKWIPGNVVEELEPHMLYQIGTALAKLHQISSPSHLSRFQSYGIQSFPEIFDKGIDLKYETWLKDQAQRFDNLIPENLPKGLIHGDLFFDNVLFRNGKLEAIIDFEEACHYFLVFDLGMAIVGLCRTNRIVDLQKGNAFLDGYKQIRSLEISEKESLQLFIEYAATATSNWRFCKYNILSPNPVSKHKHWEMVKVAEQIKSIPKDRFFSSDFN